MRQTRWSSRAESMLVRGVLQGEPVAYITGGLGVPGPADGGERLPCSSRGWTRRSWRRRRSAALHGAGRTDARVLDLCSGSGCIGCAIADALPSRPGGAGGRQPRGRGASAAGTCACNGLDGPRELHAGGRHQGPSIMTGSFDLVVSNPPYIPTFGHPDAGRLRARLRAALGAGRRRRTVWTSTAPSSKNWKGVIRQGGIADVRGRRGTRRRTSS